MAALTFPHLLLCVDYQSAYDFILATFYSGLFLTPARCATLNFAISCETEPVIHFTASSAKIFFSFDVTINWKQKDTFCCQVGLPANAFLASFAIHWTQNRVLNLDLANWRNVMIISERRSQLFREFPYLNLTLEFNNCARRPQKLYASLRNLIEARRIRMNGRENKRKTADSWLFAFIIFLEFQSKSSKNLLSNA